MLMSERAPVPYDLVARAGDTFARILTWFEDDGTTPVNLTGASVEWSLVSGTHEFPYVDVAQASITTAASGIITLTLTPTLTRALFALRRSWSYEVTVTDAGGVRTTLLDGTLSVLREVLA
jgi:hypothetical protein